MRTLPGAKYKVKFTSGFKDGAIFVSKVFRLNEEAEITGEQMQQARRSGAKFDVIGTVLPAPVPSPAPGPEEAILLQDPPDPEPVPEKSPRGKKARKDGKG